MLLKLEHRICVIDTVCFTTEGRDTCPYLHVLINDVPFMNKQARAN